MEALFELVSSTTDGVFAVDRAQRIVLWNPAVSAMLGYRAADVLGRHCYDVIAGKDDRACGFCRPGCRSMANAVASEPVNTVDLLVHDRHGCERWLNVSTLSVPSRWQELSVLVHLCRDVTRSHEAQHRIDELRGVIGQGVRPPDADGELAPTAAASSLTAREREVLRRLVAGESTATLAHALFISPVTVRNHVQSILGKLGVHSRLEAVTLALRRDLF